MRSVVLVMAALVAGSRLVPAQVRKEFRVMIPMRDGVKLATDIWLPEAPGRYPVLVSRTPYFIANFALPQWARYFASQGYAVAVQDTRGRGDSEGKFQFFSAEGKDGFDTIEWLAAQEWSTGRVGMFGLSYLGTAQWLAARERPPHLACIVPSAAGGRWFEEVPYLGGALFHGWALQFADLVSTGPGQTTSGPEPDWARILAHRPLLTADSVLGRPLPLYHELLTHSTFDGYWERIHFSAADFRAIDIPTLSVTGWFDGNEPGALFYWRGLMANAPHRDRHFLLVGPWRHPETFRGGSIKVGDSEFSAQSVIDTKAAHLAFFDWCVKRSRSRYPGPRARIYLTGANQWRSLDRYPAPTVTPRKLYLGSRGRANSSGGDGSLGWQPPGDSPPDRFSFDPKRPVPDEFENWGLDRSAIQTREDVLVYTSDPLPQPIDLIGSVVVDLQAASDARDTDFTAVLSDLGPDGRALKLGPAIGIRRARYRNGDQREELLTPGQVANFRIDLFDIAHRFARGHRIRLEISSSAVPYFTPNQNTGNPVATDTEWRVANQTVYHDRRRPSAITLPIARASAGNRRSLERDR
jgi:putative CocE/NonD family hydrolase